MIDRKVLWISVFFFVAMTAAAFWRLSLLADWTQVTFPGPKGPHTRHGLILFLIPACMLFMIALAWGIKWLVSGPKEAIQVHARRQSLMLLGTGVLLIVAQTFMISRSLNHGLSVNGETLARGTLMVSAILLIMQGNIMPKLPWLSSRFSKRQPDPWQQMRVRRFAGLMSIAYGLIMIAAAALLPVLTAAITVLVLCPIHVAVILWYSFRLRREPSPLSSNISL